MSDDEELPAAPDLQKQTNPLIFKQSTTENIDQWVSENLTGDGRKNSGISLKKIRKERKYAASGGSGNTLGIVIKQFKELLSQGWLFREEFEEKVKKAAEKKDGDIGEKLQDQKNEYLEKQLEIAGKMAKSFETWSRDFPVNAKYAKAFLAPIYYNKGSDPNKTPNKLIEQFKKSDADDEVEGDIDFEQAQRTLTTRLSNAFYIKGFEGKLQLPPGHKPISPANVLFENIVLNLTNYFFSLQNGEKKPKRNAEKDAIDSLIGDDSSSVDYEKVIALFQDRNQPRSIMLLVLNNESVKQAMAQIEPVETRKKAQGQLEKYKFIYFSGMYEQEKLREKTSKQLDVVKEVSKGMMGIAKDLIEGKNSISVDGFGQIGPVKNELGIFKKAIRKALGREKDTLWEELNYVNWPVKAERLCVSIKDIIRGTLVFSTYQQMTSAYKEIAKLFSKKGKVDQKYMGVDISKVLGISKATTGFVPAGDSATYRDMKMVVILKLDDEAKKDIIDEGITEFPGVAFEIQFNTVRGAVVKSGKVHYTKKDKEELKSSSEDYLDTGEVLEALKFRLEGAKLMPSYLDVSSGLFNVDLFLEDCVLDASNAADEVKETVKKLRKKYKGRAPIKKAHEVYKLSAGTEKAELEQIYQDIYKCAYLVDGYTESEEADNALKEEINTFVNEQLKKAETGPL